MLVHDAREADLGVRPGIVTLVDVRTSSHDVGIRLTTDTATARVVWPGRFAVHLDPIDDADNCWRCNDNSRGGPADTGVSHGVSVLPRDVDGRGNEVRAPPKLVTPDRARPTRSARTDKLVQLCKAK